MSPKLQLVIPQLLQICLLAALVLRVVQTTMMQQPMFQQQQKMMMYPSFKYHGLMEGQQLYPEPQQQHHQQYPKSARPFEGKYRYPKMMMMHSKNMREGSNYHSMKPPLAKSTILVESAHSAPVNIMFRSTSSNVNIMQDHKPSRGMTRYMNSQEEPVILVMNITKPIIQHVKSILFVLIWYKLCFFFIQVNEKIFPERKIQHLIYPIKESIETVIKKPDNGHQSDQQQPYGEYSSSEQSNCTWLKKSFLF